MKSVVLTGATGYIGQFAIKPLLERGFTVHALTSKPIEGLSPCSDRLYWHQVNLLNEAETKTLLEELRATHLLHFAWYVEHGKFWDASENLDWLRASLFLAEEFAKNGGRRIVTAGTCAEYDWTRNGPFKEDQSPVLPHSLYGAAKAAMSLALQEFCRQFDVSYASGKIFFPFGRNEPVGKLIPSVVRCLHSGNAAALTHGNQVRDLIPVDIAGDAFVALLSSEVNGAVNIASGVGVTLRSVAEVLAEIVGRPDLLRFGELPTREDEPAEIVADVSRLSDEVKFSPVFDMKKALQRTVEWWARNQ